jgi:hypothetical protein
LSFAPSLIPVTDVLIRTIRLDVAINERRRRQRMSDADRCAKGSATLRQFQSHF